MPMCVLWMPKSRYSDAVILAIVVWTNSFFAFVFSVLIFDVAEMLGVVLAIFLALLLPIILGVLA